MTLAKIIVVAILAAAQKTPWPISTWSLPVSASVVATYVATDDQLMLLVLWRGQPGWWSGSSDSGGGGASTTGGMTTDRFTYGGITLEMKYSILTRGATIRDIEINLSDTNVVLVDNVDRPAQTAVMSRLHTNPTGDQGPKLVDSLIARDRRLYEFLRCDVSLPGDADTVSQLMQKMVADKCAALTARQ